ncbi:unnamed protein product, partial [Ranitomeya imitator]
MSFGFSSNRDSLSQVPCENITIRHPVPSRWVNYFRRDSVLGERSLKAKVNREASFGSPSFSGSEPAMRVTLGTAKYEHAYNAIVWRISRLPDKNSVEIEQEDSLTPRLGMKLWRILLNVCTIDDQETV